MMHKLIAWCKARWHNPFNEDLGPLRTLECPKCLHVWKDQWIGKKPDEEIIIFYCPDCAKKAGIPHERDDFTSDIYYKAKELGIVLRIKKYDELGFFAELERRFS